MTEPENDPNAAAIVRTLKAIGKRSLIFGAVVILLVVVAGTLGGAKEYSGSNSPGWGSVIFMYGGVSTLATAIPIGLCLFFGATLLSGVCAFLYFRFFESKHRE